MRIRSFLVALALVGALVGSARAADPGTPRIGPERSVQGRADSALATLSPEEAAPIRARLEKGELSSRDVLHEVLRAKVPAYATAVANFDRDPSNAEEWQKLAASSEGPLAGAVRAYATYFEGRAHLGRDEFELACQCFDKVKRELASDMTWTDEAVFYLGYSYARRPEGEEDRARLFQARARHCFEGLAPDFVKDENGEVSSTPFAHVPERDREAAIWILRELRGEGSGPLLELARRMETIGRSLDRERTGRPIQKRQEAVVAEIERLIALMREKEGGG